MPTPTVDLTASGNAGSINGGIFTTDNIHSAGTGTFDTFVQIQHNGTEQGYNTDGAHQFNEQNSQQHNHALLLADVPIVFGDGTNGTEEGVAYREFKLDINEAGGGKRLLSLDQLQIWQEESGSLNNFNTNGTGFAGAHTNHLVYNMDAGGDNWVALNSGLSSGSGGSDMRVLIRNDLFVNDAAHRYVYLYSAFGQQGGSYSADGGFEEWGVGTPAGGPTGGAVLNITKSGSVAGGTADQADEVITYSIQVSNFGAVNLTGVTVTDPSVSDMARGADVIGNNDNVLNAGETWSYSAHRVVTQADIDTNGGGDGTIENTATADSDQTGPQAASATVAVEPKAHVTITKTPVIPDTDTAGDPTLDDDEIDSPADDISYTYTLVNDGNVTLHNPEVNDSLAGTLPIHTETGGSGTNGDGVLDVGETWTYTAAYNVTQADIDNRGSIDGTADDNIHNDVFVVTEEGAIGETFADVAIDYRPHLTFSKSAQFPDTDSPGDPTLDDGKIDNPADDISFAFTLVNDGNVTLHNVQLDDTVLGTLTIHTETGGSGVNGDDILDVGETWSYTAVYDVTQADIDDHGNVDGTADNKIRNDASVSTDEEASGSAFAEVLIDYRPHLTLTKTAQIPDTDSPGDPTLNDGKIDSPADDISYAFTLVNDGNVTLHDVELDDTLLGALTIHTETGGSGFNGDDILDVGETWSYTAAYDVTQADIDNRGSIDGTADDNIHNDASVTTTELASGSDFADVPIDYRPSLAIEKTGAWVDGGSEPNGHADAGEQVSYSVTVENTGNVTLHDVTVDDPLVTFTRGADINGNNDAVFEIGEIWDYSGSYTISPADVVAGNVHNEATATALGPLQDSEDDPEASDTDSNDAYLPQFTGAHMTLDKSSSPLIDGDESGGPSEDDPIQYFFTLVNNGTEAIHAVELDDTLFGTIAFTPDGDVGAIGVLDPGEAWSMSQTYLITQDDVDAGEVDNDATATGLDPSNLPVMSNTAHWHLEF